MASSTVLLGNPLNIFANVGSFSIKSYVQSDFGIWRQSLSDQCTQLAADPM
jgi:hypothetical protein